MSAKKQKLKPLKVKVEYEVEDFFVPVAINVTGPDLEGQLDLSEIDPLTLALLCERFRNEVFRIAGKEKPPVAAIG
ncbi:MAG: hypothetical protein AAF098_13435 [Pseudomonadota bacterium]